MSPWRIRWKLFRQFPPWHPSPYRVILRFRHSSYPWPNYWTYVSLWPGGEKPCEIGPLQMWSYGDALKHAASQWARKQQEAVERDLAAVLQGSEDFRPRVTVEMSGTGSENMDPEAAKGIREDWDKLVRSGVKLPLPADADESWRASQTGSQVRPISSATAVEAFLEHRMAYAILPERNVRIVCSCGWQSEPTEPGHQCLPENCVLCAGVLDSWRAHVYG